MCWYREKVTTGTSLVLLLWNYTLFVNFAGACEIGEPTARLAVISGVSSFSDII